MKKWVAISIFCLLLGVFNFQVQGQNFKQDMPVISEGAERSVSDWKPLTQQVIDGKKYLLYSDGSHYTGWYQMTDSWKLYFDPADQGAAATGVSSIEGKNYLFNNDGLLMYGNGTPVVDGEKYWTNADGTVNSGWLRLGDWSLYFDEETFAGKIGLNQIGGKRYMFNNDGVMQTFAGTTIVNGKKYWFTEDGSLGTGWMTLGNWTLYFDPETCEAKTGISEIHGKRYLFDRNGVMQTCAGTPIIEGKKYWIASDGSLCVGWLNLGGWNMYFDPVTCEAAVGKVNIGGQILYFNSDGIQISLLDGVQANAVCIMDVEENSIVAEKNAKSNIAPASTAKMVTALTALEYCSLDERISVGDEIDMIGPDSSIAGLEYGDVLTLKQMIAAMLLPSGNDAAYSIAVHVGQKIGGATLDNQSAAEVFIEAMNQKAQQIGAASSYFASPDGYDREGQYTTAQDMCVIIEACYRDNILREIMSSPQISDQWLNGKTVSFYNSNMVINPQSIWYDSHMIMGKTGTTDWAGCCLVSVFEKNGSIYSCAVMGSSESGRWEDTLQIIRNIA